MKTVTHALIAAAVLAALTGSDASAQSRGRSFAQNTSYSAPASPSSSYGFGYETFGGRSHVDQLAADLYQQANNICWEMYNYYQQSPNYSQAYREMYEIKEGAKRVYATARQNRWRNSQVDSTTERELQSLDNRFHNFESDVRSWRPDRRGANRTDLRSMMAACEETLHHLMDDYGVRSQAHRDGDRTSRWNDTYNNGRGNDDRWNNGNNRRDYDDRRGNDGRRDYDDRRDYDNRRDYDRRDNDRRDYNGRDNFGPNPGR